MKWPAQERLSPPGAGKAIPLVLAAIAALAMPIAAAWGGDGRDVPQIAVGDAIGIPGGLAEVTVRISGPGFQFETAQLDLLFQGDLLAVGREDCRISARLPVRGFSVTEPSSQPAPPLRRMRFALYDLSEPIDRFPEGDLFTCSFHVAPEAAPGSLPLMAERLGASGDGLMSLCSFASPVSCEKRDGTILVAEPTATGTPTLTVPAATPTPTTPSAPSATPVRCAGDCDGDGVVIIGELIAGVRIALGASPPGECAASDVDADGHVAVNELVTAVARALGGCPGYQRPVSPTATGGLGPPRSSAVKPTG
jgi:hypothetical protein